MGNSLSVLEKNYSFLSLARPREVLFLSIMNLAQFLEVKPIKVLGVLVINKGN